MKDDQDSTSYQTEDTSMTANPEQQVITALENPKYKWRTVQGVAKETGLSKAVVESVIKKNTQGEIIQSPIFSVKGDQLYTTRKHYRNKASPFERLHAAFINRSSST